MMDLIQYTKMNKIVGYIYLDTKLLDIAKKLTCFKWCQYIFGLHQIGPHLPMLSAVRLCIQLSAINYQWYASFFSPGMVVMTLL